MLTRPSAHAKGIQRCYSFVVATICGIIGFAAPLSAQITQQEYHERRMTLANSMENGALVVVGANGPEAEHVVFRQDPQLRYLAGLEEPGVTLLILKRDSAVSMTLFAELRNPTLARWNGPLPSFDSLTTLTNLPIRNAKDVRGLLDSLAADSAFPLWIAGAHNTVRSLIAQLEQAHPGRQIGNGNGLIFRLRSQKSHAELGLLREAIQITSDALHQAIERMQPNRGEYETQAFIEYIFRSRGAEGPAFASIVGSGPNSAILHYNTNMRTMRDGDMVVMDVGASYQGYAADVARTVPVNGTFTPEQRTIYQAVLNTLSAAERQARVGGTARAMYDSAYAVLGAELARIGLIDSLNATYTCSPMTSPSRCPQIQLYYEHGLGHPIGLAVHDLGISPGGLETLAVGDAFTIEPGIYIRANTLSRIPDVPQNAALRERLAPLLAQYQNIGVRIEDSYLVTEDSVERVSRVVREIEDIEALMQNAQRNSLPPAPGPLGEPKTVPNTLRTSMQIATTAQHQHAR